MAEALLLISLAIALGRASKDGLIGHDMRHALAEGAEADLLRELTVTMARADAARADGMALLALEVDAAGGWQRLLETAPEHARDAWTATQEVLRS